MATTIRTGQDLLSSEFFAQLERLALISRRAFRGRVKGERKSPRKGMSVEFSDYRPYGVGDDLRYVDWNIYGRLDRLYLKLFVDEEDLCLHVLLDASASMGFGEPTKLEYGAKLPLALGFVGLVNLERVGDQRGARPHGGRVESRARANQRAAAHGVPRRAPSRRHARRSMMAWPSTPCARARPASPSSCPI